MLTEEEVQSLRAGVVKAGNRPAQPGSHRWVLCEDGPLKGIRVRLGGEGPIYPSASFGWCELTKRGAVVAMYVPSLDPERWRFRGYETPGGGGGEPIRVHTAYQRPGSDHQ